jgi:hypothetical protein
MGVYVSAEENSNQYDGASRFANVPTKASCLLLQYFIIEVEQKTLFQQAILVRKQLSSSTGGLNNIYIKKKFLPL